MLILWDKFIIVIVENWTDTFYFNKIYRNKIASVVEPKIIPKIKN